MDGLIGGAGKGDPLVQLVLHSVYGFSYTYVCMYTYTYLFVCTYIPTLILVLKLIITHTLILIR